MGNTLPLPLAVKDGVRTGHTPAPWPVVIYIRAPSRCDRCSWIAYLHVYFTSSPASSKMLTYANWGPSDHHWIQQALRDTIRQYLFYTHTRQIYFFLTDSGRVILVMFLHRHAILTYIILVFINIFFIKTNTVQMKPFVTSPITLYPIYFMAWKNEGIIFRICKYVVGQLSSRTRHRVLAVAALDRSVSKVWWRWHSSVSQLCCSWSMAVSFRVASITVCTCFGVPPREWRSLD